MLAVFSTPTWQTSIGMYQVFLWGQFYCQALPCFQLRLVELLFSYAGRSLPHPPHQKQ